MIRIRIGPHKAGNPGFFDLATTKFLLKLNPNLSKSIIPREGILSEVSFARPWDTNTIYGKLKVVSILGIPVILNDTSSGRRTDYYYNTIKEPILFLK